MPVIKTWGTKAALVAVLLCLAHGNALADFTFDIAGSTTGQFYLGSVPLGTSLAGLSFTGKDFGQTVTPGKDITVNLGTFSVATLFAYYNPFDFKLFVDFTAPSAGGTLFTADLSGLVTIFGGSARIDFDDSPRHFAFAGPQGSGSFDFSLTDVKVSNFSTASITGKITNIAASPEPAAILLTSALMAWLIVLFRKRLMSC